MVFSRPKVEEKKKILYRAVGVGDQKSAMGVVFYHFVLYYYYLFVYDFTSLFLSLDSFIHLRNKC